MSVDEAAENLTASREPVRACIVGTGFMGQVHARSIIAAGGIVVGICGSGPGRAVQLASAFPGVRAVDSADDILALDIDVVHICTPNASHLPLVKAAIRHGLHVVCEKPLATTPDDAAELTELAALAGLVATVPFVYRYYPSVQLARHRIETDTANPLWLLHGSYLQDWMGSQDQLNWRVESAAGGASRAFGDIGVHWCDLMEFVTGQRITRVQARFANAFHERGPTGARRTVSTEDGVVMVFDTDYGAAGSVVLSQATAGRKNRLWFSFDGPAASYVFDQENPETLWVGGRAENRQLFRDPDLFSTSAIDHAPLPAGHPEGYAKNFENFAVDTYRAIRGRPSETLPTFADGLRAARITAAAVESARTGAWVDVQK